MSNVTVLHIKTGITNAINKRYTSRALSDVDYINEALQDITFEPMKLMNVVFKLTSVQIVNKINDFLMSYAAYEEWTENRETFDMHLAYSTFSNTCQFTPQITYEVFRENAKI